MKRRLQRWWPLSIFAVVVFFEVNPSLLGAWAGFPLVCTEVAFATLIFARMLVQRAGLVPLLIPIGYGIGDLMYGLNHYILKIEYPGQFGSLIYAIPYIVGMVSLVVLFDRVQKKSPDHYRLRGLSGIAAIAVFGVNLLCIVVPVLSKTPAPKPVVAILSIVFSALESVIVGQLMLFLSTCVVPAFQRGLFGLLAVNFADIAIRYSSAYSNDVGLIAPEFGWLLGYAIIVAAFNIWNEEKPAFRLARLMSVRTWATGFLIAGLSLGWFSIANFLGWQNVNQVSLTLCITLFVFGIVQPWVGMILGQLETLVDSIKSGRGIAEIENPSALPEEVAVVSKHLQEVNDRIASERDHALTLSAEIAHNLGSPVAALKAAQRSILASGESPGVVETLKAAIEAIDGVSARVLEEKRRLVGLETVERSVESAVALMRAVHPDRKIKVTMDRGSNVVPVVGLSEVLRNLIQNSLEASSEEVLVTATSAGMEHVVQVSDFGAGIPKPVLMALNRGESVTQKVNGNGIGLSSAHAWAKTLGYGFNIESSTDKAKCGTKVSIRIPRASWTSPEGSSTAIH